MSEDPGVAAFKQGAVDANRLRIPEEHVRPPREVLVDTPRGGGKTSKTKKSKPPAKKPPAKPKRVAKTQPPDAVDRPPNLPKQSFDIDDIDHLEGPRGVKVSNVKQLDLSHNAHACGLPFALMDKPALVNYLKTHKIEHEDRDRLTITLAERNRYEIYTRAAQGRRVPIDFFVAALRLWRAGYPLDPKDALNLNEMVIEE